MSAKIRAIVTASCEQCKAIMEEENLNSMEELVALLKEMNDAENPQFAESIEFEIVEESEDTE